MRFTVLASFIAGLVVLSVTAGPAQASVITTGDVDPGGAGTQPDPWAVGGILRVGSTADGTLNVEAGGVVSNTNGNIAAYSGSTGEATITGSGSQWTNSGIMSVGRQGEGTLNVEAGGVVSNHNGYIGRYSGSTGEATITGSGSQWTNSENMFIGGNSSGAGGSGTLNLDDSGLVTVLDTTKLWSTGSLNLDGGSLTTGSFDNSESGALRFRDGTLTVNGAGGFFDPGHGNFEIDGFWSDSLPELVIANTATATLSGDLSIVSGALTVTGSGSQWTSSGMLVGQDMIATGTLNVEAGSIVSSNGSSQFGIGSFAYGVATVTGTGSAVD